MRSCCTCALIDVFLLSFHSDIPKMMRRHLLLNAWRWRTWWERSAALSNPYSRRNLVKVQTFFWYHRILLSEVKTLKAFSMQEFTSASTLQFFSTRQPRYAKVSTTWSSPSPGWSASGVEGSVCLSGWKNGQHLGLCCADS